MDLMDNLYSLKLFDAYGSLLTSKQRECLEDYLVNNLTLSEISQNYGITRQAVNFNIKESLKLLSFYEEKLGLCQKYDIIIDRLNNLGVSKDTIDLVMGVLKE